MASLDDALDKLFGVPVDAFMATREALVTELKAAGDREAAATVKAQAKPTLAAHALNQLARTAGPELERLFAASRQLATGKDFKAALERQRAALEELTEKMSGDEMRELLAVVRGAMVDEALAERVKLGRFSKLPEIQVGFFGAAPEGGAKPLATKAAARSSLARPAIDYATLARAKADKEKAAQERAEREDAQRLARQLAAAERDLTRLSLAADAAEKKAAETRRLADEAAQRVKDLKRQAQA